MRYAITVIEVEHLNKAYGSTVAVDAVTFSVEKGEIFGILGPNGAGKTTTVECIEAHFSVSGSRCLRRSSGRCASAR